MPCLSGSCRGERKRERVQYEIFGVNLGASTKVLHLFFEDRCVPSIVVTVEINSLENFQLYGMWAKISSHLSLILSACVCKHTHTHTRTLVADINTHI